MKSYLFSILLLLPLLVAAQKPRRPGAERVEQYRREYVNAELGLTEEQQKSFWPIYDEFRGKLKETVRSVAKMRRQGIENMSDAEVKAFVEQKLAAEERVVALKREYLTRLQNVVNVRQLARLERVEKEFRRELVRRLKERRGGGPGGPDGPRGEGGPPPHHPPPPPHDRD